MAKPEGETPNFEETTLGNEALTPAEPAAETETPAAEAAPAESKPEEIKAEEATPEKAVKENWDDRRELKKKAAMLYLTLSGLMGIPLIFIALAHFQYLDYPIAVALCGAALMPWGLWVSRKTNTVYTAFLGLTVIALLTAICCLWTELARYKGDIRASEAKQRTTVSAPLGRAVDAERYVYTVRGLN